MDGYDCCKIIRKMIKDKKIKTLGVVACTADASQENVKRCLEIGFDYVLFKPVDHDELKMVLNKFCGVR